MSVARHIVLLSQLQKAGVHHCWLRGKFVLLMIIFQTKGFHNHFHSKKIACVRWMDDGLVNSSAMTKKKPVLPK